MCLIPGLHEGDPVGWAFPSLQLASSVDSAANVPIKVVGVMTTLNFISFLPFSRWKVLLLLPHCPHLTLGPDTKKGLCVLLPKPVCWAELLLFVSQSVFLILFLAASLKEKNLLWWISKQSIFLKNSVHTSETWNRMDVFLEESIFTNWPKKSIF